MAATYADLGHICQQEDYQQRVGVAMSIAAVNIYSESSATTGHTARAAFAVKVLAGQYGLGSACLATMQSSAIAASANANTVGNNILDSDIQTQVNAIWNALAGA